MKCVIVFAAILALSAAQFPNFNSRPARPTFQPFPAPTRVTPVPPRVYPAPSVSVVRPSSSDQSANIVRYDSDISPDGTFSYAFESDNGIVAQEQGTPRDFGGNPPVVPVVVQGSFSWTSPEGEPISVTYVADENGYQAQGSAIPTPPPIPPQIARAIEYIAKNAQKK